MISHSLTEGGIVSLIMASQHLASRLIGLFRPGAWLLPLLSGFTVLSCRDESSEVADLQGVVCKHISSAHLVATSAREVSFQLPREAAPKCALPSAWLTQTRIDLWGA